MKNLLTQIHSELLNGILSSITVENTTVINKLTLDIIATENLSEDMFDCGDLILRISNILYDNTDRTFLPLEDGVYDLLLERIRRVNPQVQVGAPPVKFQQVTEKDIIENQQHVNVMYRIDREKHEDMLYYDKILNQVPELNINAFNKRVMYSMTKNKKSFTTTPHKYPNLVGTLDKCKFVLNSQARERGVFDDSNVKILERDFFGKHLQQGLFTLNTILYVVLELKYDGISVEAEVTDMIKSARTRGDAINEVAADITPALSGYFFRNAFDLRYEKPIGMKFEAIITYDNLRRLSNLENKKYANCRNAVQGILGSNDAYKCADFITLVPLASSLGLSRLLDIEFINTVYANDECLRYAFISGTYTEVLFQIKKFVEEAEYMKDKLPFMYDGVVVSYANEDIIEALGRYNAVNKYSVAVKFNPDTKQTMFLGYTYTVGQNGVITPMINYKPVEFFGTIHTKSTGHSFERFSKLGLKKGNIITIEYVNDVMPYVSNPNNSHNENNPNPVEQFITHCPECNTVLVLSESGKSILCPNLQCEGRNIARMTNMLSKLNFKEFSEETIKILGVKSLSSFFELREDMVCKLIGPNNGVKLINKIEELRNSPMFDYQMVGALGFTSIAIDKWKTILDYISITDLVKDDDATLVSKLSCIKGVGGATINTILVERRLFEIDLATIMMMPNLRKNTMVGKEIRFTGIRDSELANYLLSLGHSVSDGAVTKKTDYLIVPYDGFASTKTVKASANGTKIVSLEYFNNNLGSLL